MLIALPGNKSSVPTWLRDQRTGNKVPLQMLSLPSCRLPWEQLHGPQPTRAAPSLGLGMGQALREVFPKEPGECRCRGWPRCPSSALPAPSHYGAHARGQQLLRPPSAFHRRPACLGSLQPPGTSLRWRRMKTELPPSSSQPFRGEELSKVCLVIKGPLISTPALGATIPSGLGGTVFAQWAVLSPWS